MAFADNLQYLRKRDKITQEELADKLQVSRQSVSKWETGEAYPETEKIIALCDIFGVTMDDLMRGGVAQGGAGAQNEIAGDKGSENNSPDCPRDAEKTELISDISPSGCGRKRSRAIGGAINGVLLFGSVLAYICMGAIANLWHPGWIIFIFAVAACAFVDKIFVVCDSEDAAAPLSARVLYGLSGMVIILSPGIYLICGCVFGNWHPSWVVFIIAAFLMIAFNGIGNAISGRTDD